MVDTAERGRATEKRHAAAKHRQRGRGKRDEALEQGRKVESAHSQAKHKARWRMRERDRLASDDDEIARWRKAYFRNVRPDLDPQSAPSKVLEFLGLDNDPYARDERSFDYRNEAWNESVDRGSPDVSWMLPELSDEAVTDVGSAIERGLGNYSPNMMRMTPWLEAGTRVPTMQRISQDERVLAQLSPEDRAAVEAMHPDDADDALHQAMPDWQPKRNPFPTSMMGTREREGDSRIGWMPWVIDQFNYSPYATGDIASFFGPETPDTVRRDVDAYKGGSSSLDRTVADAMGIDPDVMGPPTHNPVVDPVEWGSAAIVMGVPGIIGAGYRGGKKAVGIGTKAASAVRQRFARNRAGTTTHAATGIDTPLPEWPRAKPRKPLGKDDTGPYLTQAAGGSVRGDINRAFARHQPPPPSSGAGGALAAMGLGGAVAAPIALRGLEERRKKRRKN